MDAKNLIAKYQEEMLALRRDFHQHPELGNEEFRTAGKIAAYLQDCGLRVQRLHPTGVVGLLTGGRAGPTLMMRADIDALPIQEETDLPFKSKVNGVMHACGHDAHTAIVLVTARILSELRDTLAGNVKFVFEPNEENVGALSMIEQGVLENPKVDACIGLHLWASLPGGTIGLKAGPVMAGMEHFDLAVIGRGGHTATPQSAIDPVLTAANIIQSVQSLQTREIDVLREPVVLMFGKIEGGTASNVIPDRVVLSGTMRYLFSGDEASEDNPKRRFERIVAGICAAHRAEYRLEFLFGHPTLINHPDMAAFLASVVLEQCEPPLRIEPVMTLAGEDFSEFARRVPSVFYFVGCGNPEKGIDFPHHHPRFTIDEGVLPTGVEINVNAALRFFADAGVRGFLSA